MRHPPGSGDFASKRAVPGFSFHSILYAGPEDRRSDDTLGMPAFFTDLNCDQIVEAITAEREEYNLKPFFHDCLRRRDAVIYRHEAIQDLEKPSLLERVNSFARKMREMRAHLERVQKLHYKEQKQAWFVDSVELYCHAIQSFAEDLYGEDLELRGFLGFAGYLSRYASSVRFRSLVLQTTQLKEHLAEGKVLRTHQGKQLHGAKIRFQRAITAQRSRRHSRNSSRAPPRITKSSSPPARI